MSNMISGPVKWIIAGLGNPGDKYFKTRHNAGFLAIDYISQKLQVNINKLKFKALCGDAVIGDNRVLLLKPQTFMNLSGEAIQEAAAFYKIPSERILIIFDDTSLPVGKLRIRPSGSDGGHNGIKSIILNLNKNTFPRIKIGIGQKPHPDYDLADYVIGEFSKDEQKIIFDCFESVYKSCELIVEGKIQQAMNQFN